MKRILILGMKRSGHHAVTHWMCKHLGGVTHYNDCRGEPLRPSVHKAKKQSRRYGSGDDAYVYSIEEFDLAGFRWLHKQHDWWRVMLVHRDPWNWLASMLYYRKSRRSKRTIRAILARETVSDAHPEWWTGADKLEIYRQYTDEMLGRTCRIRAVCESPIFVDFSGWHESRDYRDQIGRSVGFVNSDDGRNDVVHVGSSFDFRRMHGRGSEMRINSRWREMHTDRDYIRLIAQIEDVGDLWKKPYE